jgi:thiamine pyrophosphate-dependent acetolactate synthase large subunit-like protein
VSGANAPAATPGWEGSAGVTGADAVVAALVGAEVDVAFGLPGAHNIALWPAAARAGVRIVGSRHEQGCAYAADGWARVTGRVGVALVTTGPGAANTLGAVGEAWASHSPVVVLATDIPTTVRRRGTWRGWLHECTDQAAMFAPVTKATFVAGPRDDLCALVSTAVATAMEAPRGPVYIGVPTDLLAAPATAPARPATGAVVAPAAPAAAEGWTDAAAALLDAATRPVIWAGRGAADAGAEVQALAEHLGAPVVSTYGARGLLPRAHPLGVDVPPHEPVVTRLLGDADLVLVLGSDLDAMTTQGWRLPLPSPRIGVNVDPDDATKAYDLDLVVRGDVAAVAGALARLGPTRAPWAAAAPGLRSAVLDELAALPDAAGALAFLRSTEAALPADAIVVADMAVAGYWLAGYLPVAGPRSMLYPMGWGTLGFALPAAVGAAAGAGGRPVVACCGDGGALFAIGELAAIAQEGLGVMVVVVDDGAYGMLRHGAPAGAADDELGITLASPDFAAVARGFGIPASTVEGVDDAYRGALAAAVRAGGPHVVHVRAALAPPRTTSPHWPLRAAPPAPRTRAQRTGDAPSR